MRAGRVVALAAALDRRSLRRHLARRAPGQAARISPRPLRRRLRRAQPGSDRADRGQLLPLGRLGRADQRLAAGHGPRAAPPPPRSLLRLLLAGSPGPLQRGDLRALLRRRPLRLRSQAGPAGRPGLPALAGTGGRDRARRADRLRRRPLDRRREQPGLDREDQRPGRDRGDDRRPRLRRQGPRARGRPAPRSPCPW